MQRAVQLDPTSFRRRAYAAFMSRDVASDADALQMLRELEPMLTGDRVPFFPVIALAYDALGRQEEATRLIERFRMLDRRTAAGRANRVPAHLPSGEQEAALAELGAAVDALGPGPDFMAMIGILRNLDGLDAFEQPKFLALRRAIASGD